MGKQLHPSNATAKTSGRIKSGRFAKSSKQMFNKTNSKNKSRNKKKPWRVRKLKIKEDK